MNVLRPALLTLACMLASPVMSDDLPSLGDASSSIVSPEQEFQLGRAWLSMLRNQVDAISDPQLRDFVEAVSTGWPKPATCRTTGWPSSSSATHRSTPSPRPAA